MMNNKLQRSAGILLLAGVTACGSAATVATSDAPLDRSITPSPGPTPEFDFPDVEQRTLSNGLRLWIVERPGIPLVNVQLTIGAGAIADPVDRTGLASLTAAMLTEGTTSRSATEIADQIEFLAASLSSVAGQETAGVNLVTLSSTLDEALGIFADVVINPAFDPSEWSRVQDQRLVALVQALDQPRTIATQEFSRVLYGDAHPLGRPTQGTPESVRAVSTADLRDFHSRYYVPGNAVLIVVGDITANRALGLMERHLGAWTGGEAPETQAVADPAAQPGTRVFLIDKPGAAQSEIRIGHVGVARTHPDYFPLLVMNSILGGQFTSRINLNLREDKGYTYGARSAFEMGLIAGPFVASAGVQTAVTKESVEEFMRELVDIRSSRPATAEEVEFARRSLIRSQPLSVETNGQLAARVTEMVRYELPEDYFDDYAERVAAVTVADVNRVAREYLQPDAFAIVVVGDLAEIESGVRSLPFPVEVVTL